MTECLEKPSRDHDQLLSSIHACWNATAFTVNPFHSASVDEILQCLCSPAPQSFFVVNRAVQQFLCGRQEANCSIMGLDQILSDFSYLLKPGYNFVVGSSCSEKEPCWAVIPLDSVPRDGWKAVKCDSVVDSTLEIAHKTLAMVTKASQSHINVDEKRRQSLVLQANERLKQTLGTDIRGRSSADAAFNFALAGVDDSGLYYTLTIICRIELSRVGSRTSFKSMYILQMMEKLAASGVRRGQRDGEQDVYRIAAACLSEKGEEEHSQIIGSKSQNEFDLLSKRPLLWLWRFSARQTKSTSTAATTSSASYDEEREISSRVMIQSKGNNHSPSNHTWLKGFEDTTRPLVVDVGCGMGVSLLGLSTLSHQNQSSTSERPLKLEWAKCNFIGVDLSQLSIGFAQGISRRWNLTKNVQFVCQSAQLLLEEIHKIYPGKVVLVMIQFPTPYRLQFKDAAGNSQLPSDPSSGFMVSQTLLQNAARLVQGTPSGQILLQSNCEDVAVTMKNMASSAANLACVPVPDPVTTARETLDHGRTPLRTKEWIRRGGERAIGQEWSRHALLPPRAATETEVACLMHETCIHRCLLKPLE